MDKLKLHMLPLNDDYKPDKKLVRLHKELTNIRKYYENKEFQLWLNTLTNDRENKVIINDMINELTSLFANKYNIINNKEFKDEIATFIYTKSNAQYKK